MYLRWRNRCAVSALILAMAVAWQARCLADEAQDFEFTPGKIKDARKLLRQIRKTDPSLNKDEVGCIGAWLYLFNEAPVVDPAPNPVFDGKFQEIVIPYPGPDHSTWKSVFEKKYDQQAQAEMEKFQGILRVMAGVEWKPELNPRYGVGSFVDPEWLIPRGHLNPIHTGIVRDGTPWYAYSDRSYVFGLAFSNPKHVDLRKNLDLLFDFLLRKGSTRNLHDKEVGLAIRIKDHDPQSKTFWFLSGERIQQQSGSRWFPEAMKAFPTTFEEFILSGYKDRLEISASELAKLREISRATRERTFYSVVTRESFVSEKDLLRDVLEDYDLTTGKSGKNPEETAEEHSLKEAVSPDYIKNHLPANPSLRGIEQMSILGGVQAVISRKPAEALPCELGRSGFKLPRSRGEAVVEVGRLYMEKGSATPTTPAMLRHMVAGIVGLGKVDRVVIEVDQAHARLFKSLGFEKVPGSEASHYGGSFAVYSVPIDRLFSAQLDTGR